jgi:hypothetical protein
MGKINAGKSKKIKERHVLYMAQIKDLKLVKNWLEK